VTRRGAGVIATLRNTHSRRRYAGHEAAASSRLRESTNSLRSVKFRHSRWALTNLDSVLVICYQRNWVGDSDKLTPLSL